MQKDIVAKVSNISKEYISYKRPTERLLRWRYKDNEKKIALHKLSLNIKRGETLGIIGRNGSGKSTLLQILAGIIQPTTGSVRVTGTIGALLELGSGFNPEFTGIENIRLNYAINGNSRRICEDQIKRIVDFSGIGNYVWKPIKTYSSGMVVRLAFAVHAMSNNDLLIIDEALAVGDEAFQKKCYNRLRELKESGTSIILVTHSCQAVVQHCDRVLLLDDGRARWTGRPDVSTLLYQRLLTSNDAKWSDYYINLGIRLTQAKSKHDEEMGSDIAARSSSVFDQTSLTSRHEGWLDENLIPETRCIYPSDGITITNIRIVVDGNKEINTLPTKEDFGVEITALADREVADLRFTCHISNINGMKISGQTYPSVQGYDSTVLSPGAIAKVRFTYEGSLHPGLYFIGGGILSGHSDGFLHRVVDYCCLRVTESGNVHTFGVCDLSHLPPVMIIQ